MPVCCGLIKNRFARFADAIGRIEWTVAASGVRVERELPLLFGACHPSLIPQSRLHPPDGLQVDPECRVAKDADRAGNRRVSTFA